jgi:hypothetical protein
MDLISADWEPLQFGAAHQPVCGVPCPQWRALHQSSPYLEDYYYQAFLYKHYGRRNKRTFAPESGAAQGCVVAGSLAGFGPDDC